MSIASAVGHIYSKSSYVRRLLDDHKVDINTVRTVHDLPRLPFTTKADLRAAYPTDMFCVPIEQVARIHASSGTTGRQVVTAYTRRDLDDWADMTVRCYQMAGLRPTDRVQVCAGYGLWTAGMGFQAGAERLGAMVIPAGAASLDLHLQMMVDYQTTVFCSTATFGLALAKEAARRGLRDRLALRIGIFGAERWSEEWRKEIEGLLRIEAFDIYGLTELYGPCAGIECTRHQGIHYWDDYFLIEIIDPDVGHVLSDGNEGEIVLTTLCREAAPLLRYRTGDISTKVSAPCPCGNSFPRLARLAGRSDDIVKVRGQRVETGEVESVLRAHDGIAEAIVVAREFGPGDRRLVAYYVPHSGGSTTTSLLRAHIRARLPSFMLPSAFIALERMPLTSTGKVDRAALPNPSRVNDGSFNRSALKTALETQLCEMWADVLDVAVVAIDDSFLDLGGDSLMATRVLARVADLTGIQLNIEDIIDVPSVRGLARTIRERAPKSVGQRKRIRRAVSHRRSPSEK